MARNDKEIEDLAGYRPGVMVGSKWKIMDLLDEGGFGKVYRVQDTTSPTQFAALKIESANMEGGSAIKLEKTALEQIHNKCIRPHVPQLYRTSKRKNVCYMIITLLGESLKRIKERYFPDGYPLKCWVKIAVQSLYAIKVVHDAGFVHRDIKAANFVFGHPGEPKKARMVYIIDFGLARSYVVADEKRKNAFRPRPARPHTDFRGTWNFASPSMHDYVELGRKDDLWSWLFMLMDLYATLPWANCENLEQIGKMKQNMKDEDLMMKMPPELKEIPKHLRSLGVYNRPSYAAINMCLDRVFTRSKASWAEPYDWENKDMAVKNRAAMMAEAPGYMDPGPFFHEDVIKIDKGPSQWVPGDELLTRPSVARTSGVRPTGGRRATRQTTGSVEKVSAEKMSAEKVSRIQNVTSRHC